VREACRRAGIPSVGVLSGGISREELIAGGAREVFGDTRELAEHIGDTPLPNSFDGRGFNAAARGHAVVTDTHVNKERSWTTSSG